MSHTSAAICALFALATACSAAAPPTSLDIHGDPLPRGAVERLGSLRFRIGPRCAVLGLSPDAARVLIWDNSTHSLDFIDTKTGKRSHGFRAGLGYGSADHVAISPGRVAVSDGKRLAVFDIATGKRLWIADFECLRHGNVFDSAGRVLAALRQHEQGYTATVFRADTGEKLSSFSLGKTVHPPVALALSPGGKLLLTRQSNERGNPIVCCREIALGNKLWQVESDGPAAFRADGSEVAVAVKKGVQILTPANGKLQRTLEAAKQARFLAYNADGTRLAAMHVSDGTLLLAWGEVADLWDTRTWKRLPTRQQVDGEPVALALAADRVVACREMQRFLHLNDVTEGKTNPLIGHRGRVTSLAFDGNRVVSAGWDGSIVTWAAGGREAARVRVEALDYAHDMQLSPCGRWAAWGDLLVTVRDGKRRPVDPGFRPGLASFAERSPTGSILFANGSSPREVRAMRLSDGKLGPRMKVEGTYLWQIALSPDARTAAWRHVPDDDKEVVKLFDAEAGQRLATIPIRPTWNSYRAVLRFSPCGRRLLVSDGLWNLTLFDARSGQRLHSIPFRGVPRMAALSPCGRMLAVSLEIEVTNEDHLQIIEVSSGKSRRMLASNERVTALAFSPDGRRLAAGYEDGTSLLWDVEPERSGDEANWERLSNKDAAIAYQSMWRLNRAPRRAVELVRKNVKPAVPGPSAEELKKLFAALDDEESAKRDAAEKTLHKHGRVVEEALRNAAPDVGLEARRRIRRLLESLPPIYSPEIIGALRGVEVLEMVATADARKLLRAMSEGEPSSVVTQEAKASLARLGAKR